VEGRSSARRPVHEQRDEEEVHDVDSDQSPKYREHYTEIDATTSARRRRSTGLDGERQRSASRDARTKLTR